MRMHELIKQKRLEKGFSDLELSELTGITVASIFDMEYREDELENYSLADLLKLGKTLSLSLAEIFAELASDYENTPLEEILKSRREEKGLSVEDLADIVGYDPETVEVLENRGDLKKVNLNAFKLIICVLDLPLEFMLNKLECN